MSPPPMIPDIGDSCPKTCYSGKLYLYGIPKTRNRERYVGRGCLKELNKKPQSNNSFSTSIDFSTGKSGRWRR